MVKQRKRHNKKWHNGKGFKTNGAKARKIDASTPREVNRGWPQQFYLQTS